MPKQLRLVHRGARGTLKKAPKLIIMDEFGEYASQAFTNVSSLGRKTNFRILIDTLLADVKNSEIKIIMGVFHNTLFDCFSDEDIKTLFFHANIPLSGWAIALTDDLEESHAKHLIAFAISHVYNDDVLAAIEDNDDSISSRIISLSSTQ